MQQPDSNNTPDPHYPQQSLLRNRGFHGLNLIQFCGAANDNVLKQVIVYGMAAGGLWSSYFGDGGQAIASILFNLPFILLSGLAGQFSDRYDKRTIIYWVKVSEIILALLATLGFFFFQFWICLTALVLLGCQSAFFGPAKYGIIPEISGSRYISRANGMLNMTTNIAIILGTAAAGYLADHYFPDKAVNPLTWLPGTVLVVIAFCGFLPVAYIPYMKARNPTLRFTFNPVADYWKSIRETAGTPILAAAGAWSAFYMIAGGIAFLILPDYGEVLGISNTKTAYLLAILAISVGSGCALVGFLSGSTIKPGYTLLGSCGMVTFFILLAIIPTSYPLVAVCLAGAGLMAGGFRVPLQSLLHALPEPHQRGRTLGMANAMSFLALTVGNFIFYICRNVLGMPSQQVFFVCAGLMTLMWIPLWIRWVPWFERTLRERNTLETSNP